MHMVAAYEPAAFDATNPNQVGRDIYTANPYPGYHGYYWNRVKTKAQLLGLRGFTGWPAWVQALVVGGIAAGAGYGTMRFLRHRRA